ncbi:UNVERIFIED_CONTAM: hypothetical protein Sradi_6053800 [Sesamum radiatum]|uniref:Uncharacterized protein n=1 Tax=Sesamum radiatum TaxID=300843 RepID=A0AAW2KHI4_SESRA
MTLHRNGSRSRSPHTRYHHKRPCDTAQTEQQSKRKKLFALQGPVQLSSLSRSEKQKHELDDKSTSLDCYQCHLIMETITRHHRFMLIVLQEGCTAGKRNLLRKEIVDYHLLQDCAATDLDQLRHIKERGPNQGLRVLEITRGQARHQSSAVKKFLCHESLSQPYESAERHNLGLCSINPAEPMHSASPWSSRQRPINSSSAKGAPDLHRTHCTRHNHGHRGRSISPLHIRRKDFSRESKVDIRKRSLSKSPGRRTVASFQGCLSFLKSWKTIFSLSIQS